MESGAKLVDPPAIGALIHARRREMGLTQTALADVSAVSGRFINQIERGKATAQIGKVIKVLQTLGVDLFGRAR